MKIEEIIKQKAKKEINNDENFIESGAIDSLTFIEIIEELENLYNKPIDFDETDPTKLTTINGLKEYFYVE